MSDVDAELMQEVLDVAQRQRVADVHHYRQADDLQARLEVSKRGVHGHLGRVGRVLPSLKPVCFEIAIKLANGHRTILHCPVSDSYYIAQDVPVIDRHVTLGRQSIDW